MLSNCSNKFKELKSFNKVLHLPCSMQFQNTTFSCQFPTIHLFSGISQWSRNMNNLIKDFHYKKLKKMNICSSNFLAESSDMGCKSLELHGTQLFFANSEIIECTELFTSVRCRHTSKNLKSSGRVRRM